MTQQTKMPEPVAHRSKESPYLFILGGPEADGFDGLITTDQAEAYAAARVREALEQAAGVVMEAPITARMINDDGAKALAIHANARIRALIPQQ